MPRLFRSICILIAVALGLIAPSAATASFPGDDGRVAMLTNYGDLVWTTDTAKPPGPGSSGTTTLDSTSGKPYVNKDPSWAPNGRRLILRRTFRSRQERGGLYMFSLRTRRARRLDVTSNRDRDPSFSPSGRRIVYQRRMRDGDSDIFTARPDGSDRRRLTHANTSDRHALWSPDGDRIAFCRNDVLTLMKPNGRDKTPLPEASCEADWHPNGDRLVFARGGDVVFAIDEDGSDLTLLTTAEAQGSALTVFEISDPVWSPSGAKIVYRVWDVDGDGVWFRVMDANGTILYDVTTENDNPTLDDPAWQPRSQ